MHHSWKNLSVVFGATLCGALLAGAIMSMPSRMTSGLYADQVISSQTARANLEAAEGLSAAFRNVAEVLKPSVVSISTTTAVKARRSGRGGGLPPGFDRLPPMFRDDILRQFQIPDGSQVEPQPDQQREGMGSGIIARADGYILTNNHVIEGADKVVVELSDGRKIDGTVVGTDPPTDLAVVKIEATGLKPVAFGDSDEIQVGDWVLAIGSPFGLDQTVTAGIISGKNRVQGIVGGTDGFEDFLQTDAAINPGNSGGPLVNLRGELVGLNTAILSRSGSSAGIGFAIPVSLAQPVLDSIIETGSVRRGFIGAQVADVNPDVIKEFDLKIDSGALIRGVVAGQPAATAGLEPGDVVRSIDGKSVTSGTQLRNLIAAKPPGSSVTLSVNRGGKSMDLQVNLQERTEERLAKLSSGGDKDIVNGAKVTPLTEELAKDLGVEGVTEGLVVTDIQTGSFAAQNGLAAGDIIEQINGKTASDADQLRTAFSELEESGRAVRLLIRRGDLQTMVMIRAARN